MVKCEVIEKFTLKEFDKLKNIERASNIGKYGELNPRDTFECDEKMADYLTGNNASNKVVVKVVEVMPEKKDGFGKEIAKHINIITTEEALKDVIPADLEEKPKKTTKKKTSKK